jgi:hypothetical protein
MTTLLVVAMIFLLLPLASSGQITLPYDVVGCGGGEMSGVGNVVRGTLGQGCIGVASGPGNIHEIGFWYLFGEPGTGIDEGDLTPTRYWLGQNHPNPFNPMTTLKFSLPQLTRVIMKLYDASGREVRTLVDEELPAGHHSTVVEAQGLASGIYFCRMVAGSFVETRKLVLLK